MKNFLDEIEKRIVNQLIEARKPKSCECSSQELNSEVFLGGLLDELNFSFDDDTSLDSTSEDENSLSLRNIPVDVWFADDVTELQEAMQLLSPSVPQSILPHWGSRSSVVFLFRPKNLFDSSSQILSFRMDLEDDGPIPYKGDLEDLVNGRGAGAKVIVLPSEILENRSVILAQIKSDQIQIDQKEPCLDYVLKFFDCRKSRFVFFLSPLPAQFGVLKMGIWWNQLASHGRFHQVLCKPENLSSGNHDFSDPIQGAVNNFHKTIELFYPDSWLHIYSDEKKSNFTSGKVLLYELLSEEDEGPIGAIKQFRIPSPLVFGNAEKFSGNILSGSVKLAFLKFRLACEEHALDHLGERSFSESFFSGVSHQDLMEAMLEECKLVKSPRLKSENVKWLSLFEDYLFFHLTKKYEEKFVSYAVDLLNKIMVNVYAETNLEIAFYREMVKISDLQKDLENLCRKLQEHLVRIDTSLTDFAVLMDACESFSVVDERDSFNCLDKLITELSSPKTQKLFLMDEHFAREVSDGLNYLRSLEFENVNDRDVENLLKKICTKHLSNDSFTATVNSTIDSLKKGEFKPKAKIRKRLGENSVKKMTSWDKLYKAMETGASVSGTVLGKGRGALDVLVYGLEAILPYGEIDRNSCNSVSDLVGKEMEFYLVAIEKSRLNIVLSNKGLVSRKNSVSFRISDRTADLLEMNLHPEALECMRSLCKTSNLLYLKLVEAMLLA